MDALYLQAITETVSRNFPNAIKSYSEIVDRVPITEKAYAYFDLGRAYEKSEDIEKAINNYNKAIELDPQCAAAFLRLGILYWRKQDVTRTETAFQRAVEIYRASSNFEGVAEVLFQHGVVYDLQDKEAEARAKFARLASDCASDRQPVPANKIGTPIKQCVAHDGRNRYSTAIRKRSNTVGPGERAEKT